MSVLEPRIGLKPLAALCRRLATSLGAGVDVRNVFAREATNARGFGRSRLREVREAVAGGSTIADALGRTGRYFPEFFRELVQVGEESGHLPEVLRRLAEHYEHQLKRRRSFLAAITWPAIELTLALSVVGLLIWAMGEVPQLRRTNADLLGFGLRGNAGLASYVGLLALIGAALFAIYRATARGMLWVAPVQRAIMFVPRLGRAIETLAMAQLAWCLYVTLNAGMELRRALALSIGSTNNVVYTRHIDRVLSDIRQGHEIHEALGATGAFPPDFLELVQVGEESGRLVESMGHVADEYQEQARLALNTLTILLGFAVTALVGAVIIFLIFRLAGFYTGVIQDAAGMRR
jgi:type IV pilus assembly protein PilC